jgi:hypothetical protein
MFMRLTIIASLSEDHAHESFELHRHVLATTFFTAVLHDTPLQMPVRQVCNQFLEEHSE